MTVGNPNEQNLNYLYERWESIQREPKLTSKLGTQTKRT